MTSAMPQHARTPRRLGPAAGDPASRALWLAVFFLVPFLIVLKISLSQTAIAQPPYVPVLDLAAGWQGLRDFVAALSFDNYALLGSDSLYSASYLQEPRRSPRSRPRSCC